MLMAMTPPTNPLSLALWNFSAQWFLIPQGTGILAVILYHLDYQFPGLHTLASIVWVYTIVLLGLTLFIYALRIMIHPKRVVQQLRTVITETSGLASICIAFTTIIQMIALKYGHDAGIAAFALWWVNAGMAVVALMGIPYVQLKLQPPGMARAPPSILLPFIAALTSAAAGGVVCHYGKFSYRLQVPIVIVSYLEIGAGLALALAFDGAFFQQHYRHNFPTQQTVYQDMIMCGPFGQASFALQSLGQVVLNGSFAHYNRGIFLTAEAAKPIGYISQLAGLFSWGYGTFWWCFAIISIFHTVFGQEGGWRKIEYSLSEWALIFPWVCVSKLFSGSLVWFTLLTYQRREYTPTQQSNLGQSWTHLLSPFGRRPSF